MRKIDKDVVMERAIHDCMKEMYEKAQPAADWDNIVEEYRQGKIGKDERVYERHYLSYEEFKYILDKYQRAYRFKDKWYDYVDIVRKYLTDGGLKDSYVKEITNPDGSVQPGYRAAEHVPPIKNRIAQLLQNKFHLDDADNLSEEITNLILDSVDNCRNFFRLEHDESSFSVSVALGASPTSNSNTVKEWWKENYDQDIEIEERNPLLLWERDEYGDEFEDIMEEEYGPNWKEIWDERWKKEKSDKTSGKQSAS